MSVLIKGMEMPKSCYVCPFMKTNDDLMSDDYRYMYCDFPYIGEFVTDYEKSRHPDCPLIPVPPHGDLIDRDKLEKDIDNYIGGEESRSRFHHWVQVQSVVIPGNKGAET